MTTFEITGMTCGGCVKRVQAKLEAVAPGVQVQLKPPQATVPGPADVNTLQAALAGSHYGVTAPAVVEPPPVPAALAPSWFATYRPLLLILAYILGASMLVQGAQVHGMETMRYFMAGFFLVFSFFKLLDVPAFADAYAGYDLLARRWRPWGHIYPYVELALGVAYLANFAPLWTNAVTLVVMGFSAIGVIGAVLDKRAIRCACLGTVFQLPMSTVTIIEDVGMVLMAAAALWL
ncbi:Copper chaperone CopZ [Rhodoferax sp. OV413]|uniref:heavy-metal-associated domain-containing protein n=1 Tax=Rhodoferax sp. OV413 TaxID=1855285 RepID=UPI00088C045A|nr:heavy metal-associated domain-containing protein [Rhodoferax sp. OV413]SDN93083.1 Copper chaperone CopZ [Rhodoferax sp. OV413]